MKKIAILGSTGSIGKNTVRLAKRFPEEISITALACEKNIEELGKQIELFSPDLVAVFDEDQAKILQKKYPRQKILSGDIGLHEVASHPEAELVVSAISGTKGLKPTIDAILSGKKIALANKEALVSGGEYIVSLAKKKNVSLIPIDSEHSAIFQCIQGEDLNQIRRIILTSSGGPFLGYQETQFNQISIQDALNHPKWTMGKKVTIDSSTLMNKGLEVIEAHWLFNLPLDKIDVVIHPESIIHSLVEWKDGSIKAQMSEPDMRIPIQYAVMYPRRLQGELPPFDFTKNNVLRFFPPDLKNFRCLSLAYSAVKEGKSYPCFMNAANEELVMRFLQKNISWKQIGTKLENLMMNHKAEKISSLDSILEIERQAKELASEA